MTNCFKGNRLSFILSNSTEPSLRAVGKELLFFSHQEDIMKTSTVGEWVRLCCLGTQWNNDLQKVGSPAAVRAKRWQSDCTRAQILLATFIFQQLYTGSTGNWQANIVVIAIFFPLFSPKLTKIVYIYGVQHDILTTIVKQLNQAIQHALPHMPMV